jgi:hypothetical protein
MYVRCLDPYSIYHVSVSSSLYELSYDDDANDEQRQRRRRLLLLLVRRQ